MSDPVLHIKFENKTLNHRPKYGECFSFGKQFLFVSFLCHAISVDWKLS